MLHHTLLRSLDAALHQLLGVEGTLHTRITWNPHSPWVDPSRKASLQALRAHALGLRSVWDARLAQPGEEEALLTTWKFRADGETQRVIDYIWCPWVWCRNVHFSLPLRRSAHKADVFIKQT
jgi:hypothetical protein